MRFDECAVIEACLRGNSRAQALLYRHFSGKMTGVLYRYLKNQNDLEDALQIGFTKVFKNLSRFRKDGSLEGWIRRIMVNTAIDHLKARLNYEKNTETTEHPEYIAEAEDQILYATERDYLMTKIAEMPEGFKLIFNLYAIEGFSHKEIAGMLNISESTSKTQYIRAKKRLLSELQKSWPVKNINNEIV